MFLPRTGWDLHLRYPGSEAEDSLIVKLFMHPCKEFTCPTCKALGGEDCKTPSGRVVTFHAARMNVWKNSEGSLTSRQKQALRKSPEKLILLSVFKNLDDAKSEVHMINEGEDHEWNPRCFRAVAVENQETREWEVCVGYRVRMKTLTCDFPEAA